MWQRRVPVTGAHKNNGRPDSTLSHIVTGKHIFFIQIFDFVALHCQFTVLSGGSRRVTAKMESIPEGGRDFGKVTGERRLASGPKPRKITFNLNLHMEGGVGQKKINRSQMTDATLMNRSLGDEI